MLCNIFATKSKVKAFTSLHILEIHLIILSYLRLFAPYPCSDCLFRTCHWIKQAKEKNKTKAGAGKNKTLLLQSGFLASQIKYLSLFKFSISINIEGGSVAEQSNALHFREIETFFFYFGGWVGNSFFSSCCYSWFASIPAFTKCFIFSKVVKVRMQASLC